MKKSVLVLAVLGFAVAASHAVAGTILLDDNFASNPVTTWPAGWTKDGNAASDTADNGIVLNPVRSGLGAGGHGLHVGLSQTVVVLANNKASQPRSICALIVVKREMIVASFGLTSVQFCPSGRRSLAAYTLHS